VWVEEVGVVRGNVSWVTSWVSPSLDVLAPDHSTPLSCAQKTHFARLALFDPPAGEEFAVKVNRKFVGLAFQPRLKAITIARFR